MLPVLCSTARGFPLSMWCTLWGGAPWLVFLYYSPPTLIHPHFSLKEGRHHCVAAQYLVEASCNGLRRSLEGRPDRVRSLHFRAISKSAPHSTFVPRVTPSSTPTDVPHTTKQRNEKKKATPNQRRMKAEGRQAGPSVAHWGFRQEL